MKRINRLKRTKVLSEISIIIGALLTISNGILLFSSSPYFLYAAIGFFVGISLVIIGGALFSSLRTKVNMDIIPTYFDGAIDNVTYSPFHGISAYQVSAAEHMKEADAFSSQNLFTGSIDQYPFIISHVSLKRITNQNTKRMKATFKGPVIIIDINHSFNMRTHVLTEGQTRIHDHYQKYETLTASLDEAFTVYTNDTARANRLLNTYMSDTINHFHEHHPKLNISFLDKKIILTMNDDVNAFNMKLFKPSHLERLEALKEDINILKSLLTAIDIYFKS